MTRWLLALLLAWPTTAAGQACEQPPRVPRHVIAEAMRGLDAQWDELARAVRSRRFGETLPATRDERARQARFLEQRGFAAEHIRAALAS